MSDILSISRLRIGTDGQGITTLIGFYGCPLNCKYCINQYCHDKWITRAKYSAEELLDVLSIDEPYFLMTGGGVTFGGGEPLLQSKFIHELCSIMPNRWRRTIETSLFCKWEDVELLLDDIDYWFIDIKEVNSKIYKSYTGAGSSNKVVLDNLKRLIDAIGYKKVCIRYPLIPEYNTDKDRTKGIDYIRNNISAEVDINLFKYFKC